MAPDDNQWHSLPPRGFDLAPRLSMLIQFSGDDEQKSRKEHILDYMGLSRNIALVSCQITELIKVARIACLNEMELYFGVETTEDMVNPRNEAAALSFLLQELTNTPGAPSARLSLCIQRSARLFALFVISCTKLCRTGERKYIDWADRLYQWTRAVLRSSL